MKKQREKTGNGRKLKEKKKGMNYYQIKES
jgi:hypothetical protein